MRLRVVFNIIFSFAEGSFGPMLFWMITRRWSLSLIIQALDLGSLLDLILSYGSEIPDAKGLV